MIAAQFVVPFSDCTNWQRKGSSTFYNSSCLENPSSSRFRKKQKAIRFSWRKSFQHDLYPDTRSTVPALTAEEFMEGKINAFQIDISKLFIRFGLKLGLHHEYQKIINHYHQSCLGKNAPPKLQPVNPAAAQAKPKLNVAKKANILAQLPTQ